MTLETSLREKRSDLGLEVDSTFGLTSLRHGRAVVDRMPKREDRNVGNQVSDGTNMEGTLHMFSLSMSIFDPSTIEMETAEILSLFKHAV